VNFARQKFFIVLMDFFSMLLQSALLTWLLMGEVGPVMLGDRYAKLARQPSLSRLIKIYEQQSELRTTMKQQ
jgi:hypothetical protein